MSANKDASFIKLFLERENNHVMYQLKNAFIKFLLNIWTLNFRLLTGFVQMGHLYQHIYARVAFKRNYSDSLKSSVDQLYYDSL